MSPRPTLRTLAALAALTLSAAPALAQRVAMSAAHESWIGATTNIQRAAEQMSDADFAFRPVATVRTFGQLVGHVAGAQKLYCATALGEKAGDEGDIEKTATTKAALVAALKSTTAYCERAYAQTDAAASAAVTVFGQKTTRLGALIDNASHNAEHYGNIVTYMRIKGMVPPSSQPTPK